MSHRLSKWCSRAPDLEDDIALSNIALDLLGQARCWRGRARGPLRSYPCCRRVPGADEDALAFLRDGPPATCRWSRSRTATSRTPSPTAALRDRPACPRAARGPAATPVLAAVAAKGAGGRPATATTPALVPHPGPGHRGVPAPRARALAGLAAVRRAADDPLRRGGRDHAGVGVDPAHPDEVDVVLEQVLAVSGGAPRPHRRRSVRGRTGRDGRTPRRRAGCSPRCRSSPAPIPQGLW